MSSVIIAIAAIIALKQIQILKQTLRVQSKRDALKLTSDQCSIYMSEIIPLQDIFHKAVKDNKVTYFEGWDVEINNEQISISRKSPPSSEGMLEIIKTLSVLNRMESFSSFFTSNVADELVAYNTIGITYLNCIRELLPWILPCSEGGYYKNITKLFLIWESKRLHQEIMKKKDSLDKQLSQTKFRTSFPVGTDIT